jgi:hypothetical protein
MVGSPGEVLARVLCDLSGRMMTRNNSKQLFCLVVSILANSELFELYSELFELYSELFELFIQ